MLKGKKLNHLTVLSIQNKSSNPADASEMTQCFDMQAENMSYFVCLQS